MSVFILAASRTPMGALGGTLKPFSAPDLAAALLDRLLAGMDPGQLDGLVLGQAVQAGNGPNPARTVAQQAGLPPGLPAFTLNQGPASGLRAVVQAVQSLQAGAGIRMVAGGMESVSSTPYLLPTARWGTRMGVAPVLDAWLQDGQEAEQRPLGEAALALARQSQAQASAARASGSFRAELTPLALQGPRGPVRLAEDESQAGQDGTAQPADGAAALLLATQAPASLPPLARILGTAQGHSGLQAIQRVLQQAGLAIGAIDRFELDDSSPASLADLLAQLPALARARMNGLGGALALGHPLGATGARMVVSLAHQLRENNLRYGLAAMEAHGSGLALLLEQS